MIFIADTCSGHTTGPAGKGRDSTNNSSGEALPCNCLSIADACSQFDAEQTRFGRNECGYLERPPGISGVE